MANQSSLMCIVSIIRNKTYSVIILIQELSVCKQYKQLQLMQNNNVFLQSMKM